MALPFTKQGETIEPPDTQACYLLDRLLSDKRIGEKRQFNQRMTHPLSWSLSLDFSRGVKGEVVGWREGGKGLLDYIYAPRRRVSSFTPKAERLTHITEVLS